LQLLKNDPSKEKQLESGKEFGRLAAFKSADARNVGLIGLMSMLYSSKSPEVIDLITGFLIGQLDSHSYSSQAEFEFMAESILNGFVEQKELMNFTTIQLALQTIERGELQKFKPLEPIIEKFIAAASAAHGESAEAMAHAANPTGQITISELVAAETIRTLPSIAAHVETKKVEHPNIDAVLLSLRELHALIIQTLWPSLLKSSDVVMLVMFLDRIGQNLVRQRRKTRRLIAALVTHPSATLPKELLDKHPVYVIPYDPENYIRIFHDMFASLNNSGFSSVFAILPHSDFWHSYHHARHSQSQPTANVIVIDSKLYGLGLGILVREVANRMSKLRRRDEIEGLIRKIAPNIHYWIVPSQTKTISSHFWFQKMKRQSNWKNILHAKQTPILGFGETAGIVATGSSLTQSLVKLEGMVLELYQRNNSHPRVIVIEHHNMLPVASSLSDYFKQTFKETKVLVQQASPFLSNEIGDYIGLVSI
jgi:fatty acid-binding protein DegV